MIRRKVKVLNETFEIRLPETTRDLKKLAQDDFSYTRLLQVGIHQRQLQRIAALMKADRAAEEIQFLMDHYKYKAHDVGGSVEACAPPASAK